MLKKTKKPGFNISSKEIHDLTKAWLILSLAFAIAFKGFSISFEFILAFIISILTVGTAFVFHEMAHKIVAQRYGCFAEFRSFDNMLWFALFMSLFGFIFAAPGAVMISGPVGKSRNGKISLAGPAVNIILAILFLIIGFRFNGVLLNIITSYGFMINSWLALFNMLPFFMLDGKKVLSWSKPVYFTTLGIIILLRMLEPALL